MQLKLKCNTYGAGLGNVTGKL